MILVTTPTGDIGARVLRHILNADAPLRVIVRDPAKLPDDMKGKVDVVEGSHADAAPIGAALDSVDRVFWLPPGDPTAPSAHAAYVAFTRSFAHALPSTGVTHVVGVSALGGGWETPSGLVSESLAMDDLIGGTGVAYRALTCASLMDNLMRQTAAIRDGAFYAPTPGALRLPHVAKADVAMVAARLLLSPEWHGVEEVPLHGPEDLSFSEMARILSDVLGRDVAFHEMSMDAFDGMLRAMDTSDGMARDYAAMMTAKNEGMDAMLPDAPRGDTPTTFRFSSASRGDYATPAAAMIRTGADVNDRILELAGDTGYTLTELAEQIARQSGKPVRYDDKTPAAFADTLRAAGLPEGLVTVLADTDAHAAQGALHDDSGTLGRLIGRPTTPLRDAVSAVLKSDSTDKT